MTFDHTKNVFVFDEDIDVFNPTDILWAIATRVQPHLQVNILKPLFRGNFLDPSLRDEIKTSGMIVDATKTDGPAVLAGVEMPRRSDGADQVGRLCAGRSLAAYSDGPDDLLGIGGCRAVTMEKFIKTEEEPWVRLLK